MSAPSYNVLAGYRSLCHSVNVALHTQIGDAARLEEQKRLCLQFLADVHNNSHLVSATDSHTMIESIERMVEVLDNATTTSSDIPDSYLPSFGDRDSATGNSGRPSVTIQPSDLTLLATGRTTRKELAELYGCSPRTIRRRLIEFGLSPPGPPVYVQEPQLNGEFIKVYSAGVCSDLSTLSAELDILILQVYEQFPSFGRRMIDGYLMHLGERVPRRRILDSYNRVIGPSSSTFATRRIQRRVYSVPGPNSLWHHDGQHGLIRWKIVIHAFIDGFSRFLLGIRASSNNRATTVLDLFQDITDEFGYPSRVRGDHGTENLLVAGRMEQVRGTGRGSYIFGRSVHNIRIERLWVDITSGFGKKWKDFFRILESHDNLNIDNDAHIWLIHHLFLNTINYNAETWGGVWNSHTLARRGEPYHSPNHMYLYGMITNGVRGVQLEEPTDSDDSGDFAGYGVDWDDIDDHRVHVHHLEQNVDDHMVPAEQENVFLTYQPHNLSHIEVPDPRCPFNAEQVQRLNSQISLLPIVNYKDMHSRRLLWVHALQIALELL